MRAIKQDDVIDVIYDSWYGLPLDEADKVVWDYAHRKLIPIEWIRKHYLKSDPSLYTKEDCIIENMLIDWEEENGSNNKD